jgi:hypothetical protein
MINYINDFISFKEKWGDVVDRGDSVFTLVGDDFAFLSFELVRFFLRGSIVVVNLRAIIASMSSFAGPAISGSMFHTWLVGHIDVVTGWDSFEIEILFKSIELAIFLGLFFRLTLFSMTLFACSFEVTLDLSFYWWHARNFVLYWVIE